MIKNIRIILFIFCLVPLCSHAGGVRFGFVYLHDIDPSILTKLKYHQDENFTGRSVKGCRENQAIITEKAAIALSNAQEEFSMHGYSLVVYNAYHPYKAYEHFQDWLEIDEYQSEELIEKKSLHHPNLSKEELKNNGYIETKYQHVKGSTVDVTIIALQNMLLEKHQKQYRSYSGQKKIVYLNDGSVDMGTSHDFFDPLSKFDHPAMPQKVKENRSFLKRVMQNHGFKPNEKVWWQFTLAREPYVNSKFDFDI